MQHPELKEGWVEWRGGECPLPRDLRVNVRLRSGEEPGPREAGSYAWGHYGTHGSGEIVAYRIPPMELPRSITSPLDTQVGGGHYKDMVIQPVEFIHTNGIGYMEGNVIKYVTRWRKKNGIADLEKARHYIDLLIEMENRNARKTD